MFDQKTIFFLSFLLRAFDEEERTLRAHARSGVPRSILDTFYNYEQVKYNYFITNKIFFCQISLQLG
jgi:hypothetical protein